MNYPFRGMIILCFLRNGGEEKKDGYESGFNHQHGVVVEEQEMGGECFG